jgi:hypothetical protein
MAVFPCPIEAAMLSDWNTAALPRPDEPHRFVPRKYGSRDACEICGAAVWHDVHGLFARYGEPKKPKP